VRQTQAVSTIGGVLFSYEDGVLWMTLPSGRRMAYWDAKYEESRSRFRQGRTLSYMYIDQNTKKWLRIETWGGRLVENLVQATARDCLRETMMALDAAGFDIRAHVHDEVIINEPVDGRTHEDVCAIMAREIPWAPGLPLCGDGYETPFYMKD
jgi:DNA polymerase